MNRMYKGVFLLLIAEFCFATATVFVKYITKNTDIPAIELSFFRFFFGVFIAYVFILKSGQSLKPNNTKTVVWRGVLNTISVILFFIAIKMTTVTNANMLNMTYPVFIFIFLAIFSKSVIKNIQWVYLFISIVGIVLVIQPNFTHVVKGDIIGLFSGIIGGLAIIALSKARKFDTTPVVLFYAMLIGVIMNGIVLIPFFVMPISFQWVFVIISAVIGVMGQLFLTSAYKYIDAQKGSIVSTSRILFAVVLGVSILSEDLNLLLITGGVLIIFSVVSLTLGLRKNNLT